MQVENRLGPEVHFTRLGLGGSRWAVNPRADHQALGAPRRLSSGVRLQAPERSQRAAQEEVEPAGDVEHRHVYFGVSGSHAKFLPVGPSSGWLR